MDSHIEQMFVQDKALKVLRLLQDGPWFKISNKNMS